MVAQVLPLKSLDAVTTTGVGTVLGLGGLAQKFQMVVTATGMATSSPFSSGNVSLQGSLDGAEWFDLVNSGISTSPSVVSSGLATGTGSNNYMARYIRANATQIVPGGGSPVITAVIAVGGE